MPFQFFKCGNAPPGNRSLYISMHGGGSTSPSVNDQQWVNQQHIYRAGEGFNVAPRAPTNTWGMWHQLHVDPMFDRLIENFVAFRGVSPNKVYTAGYSAGGDGVYRLAPRMAGRWAAAAMMAGHLGEAEPHNLNNLPYIIRCGAKDTAYDRNQCALDSGKKLGGLAKDNPGEYPHECIVYPEYGHWMKKNCARASPWWLLNVETRGQRRLIGIRERFVIRASRGWQTVTVRLTILSLPL